MPKRFHVALDQNATKSMMDIKKKYVLLLIDEVISSIMTFVNLQKNFENIKEHNGFYIRTLRRFVFTIT
ncbi:hypothetical protein CON64_02750 [Bacillus pseudomycoides]|nr:hypothetical protein CON64_02750 [Bacillus pseudomycoides]